MKEYLTLAILFASAVHSLHLTGTFNNKDFYTFLAKFGFQKADSKNLTSTIGYIYGTITAKNYNISDIDHDMYLVVVWYLLYDSLVPGIMIFCYELVWKFAHINYIDD